MSRATTPVNTSEKEAPVAPPPIKKKAAKPTARVQDLSYIFMLRAFAQSLEDRATALHSLAENLKNYANKKEMMEDFQKKFPPKLK